MEDSQSLTASDFDILNKENFFDSINDVFNITSKSQVLKNSKQTQQSN